MKVEQSLDYTRKWAARDPKFLQLQDGSRLRYLEIGDGPPLLLMHTVRTQLDLFQRLIPTLTESFTIFAVDFPGFGWSDIVPGAKYAEPVLRARMKEFVTRLGLRDFTLAGESIGAVLALTLGADPTIDARRVVAFNAYDYFPGLERANVLASFIIKNVRLPVIGSVFARMENRAILSGIMKGGVYDPRSLPDHFIDELEQVGKRPGYSTVARAVYKSLSSFVDARSLYPSVKIPVTLAYGENDWSRPGERQANAKAIPQCTLITIPRSGHFSTFEHPDDCARILLNSQI